LKKKEKKVYVNKAQLALNKNIKREINKALLF